MSQYLTQSTYIFVGITVIGLIIMAVGFKFSNKTRKVIETIGAITFHVGIFGILYLHVSVYLFVSLVALILSLFILFDPVKINAQIQSKIYPIAGWFLLAVAMASLVTYFTEFPLYLWIIPIVVYLLTFMIPVLKKHKGKMGMLVWLIILSYFVFIGYTISQNYKMSDRLSIQKIKSFFTDKEPSALQQEVTKDLKGHKVVDVKKTKTADKKKSTKKVSVVEDKKTTPKDKKVVKKKLKSQSQIKSKRPLPKPTKKS